MELTAATVNRIIDLARNWDRQYKRLHQDKKTTVADSEITFDSLMAYRDDPVKAKLMQAIDELSMEERAELVALYWMGRSAKRQVIPDEYGEEYEDEDEDEVTTEEAWETYLNHSWDNNPAEAAGYLVGKKAELLVRFLTTGMNEIGLK